MYIILLFSFLTSLAGSYFLIKYSDRIGVLAVPDDRTLHDVPTPRTGGIAIIVSVIAYTLLQYPPEQYGGLLSLIITGLSLVAAVSLVDDIYSVGPIKRLIVHILASFILIKAGLIVDKVDVAGYVISFSYFTGVVITILAIIWLINLYNFMDGMDGFAGGMTIVGFGTFAVMGYISGNTMFMLVCLIIVCSSAGFHVFNFPPAKIFMGDIGASSLGFLVAAMALWADKENIFPIIISIIVFSPFIIDATVTLTARLINREKVWKAHNKHYYQKLVKMGYGHRKTVLLEYGLMLFSAIIAISYYLAGNDEKIYLLIAYIFIYIGIISYVHMHTNDQNTMA